MYKSLLKQNTAITFAKESHKRPAKTAAVKYK